MKNIINIVFILLFFSSTNAQDTTFNKLIHSYPGTLGITSILKFQDHYYCLIINVDTPNLQTEPYGILKLDNTFTIVDSNRIDIGHPVIQLPLRGFDVNPSDSSFIFAGSIHYYIGSQIIERGYIAKFDKNLDTLWTKEIAHPDTSYADTCQTPWLVLNDVKVTPTGKYLIAGNYNHQCGWDRDRAFLILMNANGTIIWQKFFNPVFQPEIRGVELDNSDSGFYCVFRFNSHHHLYKLDKHGNIEWSVPYNQKPYVAQYYGIKANEDIIIATSVYRVSLQESIWRLRVACINKQTQTVVWAKDFHNNIVSSIFLRGETKIIEFTKSGNIAIGMTGYTINVGNRPRLLMLSPNGDSLWCRYYSYEIDKPDIMAMEFHDMVLCDDGGFLLGGTLYDPELDPIFMKAWLIKTDSNGIAPGAYTISVEEHTILIKREPPVLYPVPATDLLNIRFQEFLTEMLFIEVFNLSGQRVLHEQIPSFDTEYRINIHDLPAGTYVIRLSTGHELLYNGKFVKR